MLNALTAQQIFLLLCRRGKPSDFNVRRCLLRRSVPLLRNARESRELKKNLRHLDKQLAQLGYTEENIAPEILLNIDLARANLKTSIYDQAILEGVATTFPQTEDILENRKVSSDFLRNQ